ncbi:MAG: universal stress protein [Lentimicrobiaceae bacterium]|nr:universal stress protein [Lentimicrobiaceae bacterium]
MKNIIVGIDFSETSLNALEHGVSLALRLKSKLTLLFVVSPDAKLMEEIDKDKKSNIVDIAEKKMQELLIQCQRLLPKSNVKYKIRIGKVSQEINAEAKEQGDAIIVVGTHGCSGFEEFFIGNSALRIINQSECPIITVRGGVDMYRDLTSILVLIDDTRETLQKLKLAAPLAKAFNAKVEIMGFYLTQYQDIKDTIKAYVHRAEMYLTERDVRFATTFVESTEKVKTVLDFAQKKDVNLIVVMKEVEMNGENVFVLAPFSERIVNRSPIPILNVSVDKSIYPGEI